MNTEESIYVLTYIKYPYLFPGSGHEIFEYYFERIQINQDVSRIPSHPRHFIVNFGEDGRLLAKDEDEKVLTNYQGKEIQSKNK
jgi:hypothetical protein